MKWIQWNGQKHSQALHDAFWESMFLLGFEFTKAITSPIWPWPNGESPRDIVDLNGIRDSQYGPLRWNYRVAQFVWTAEYAIYVHEGATLRNGTVLPARPWTRHAMREYDLMGTITKLYQQKVGS